MAKTSDSSGRECDAGRPQSRLCACGCGRPTPLAKTTDPSGTRRRGHPCRYIKGHHRRKRDRYVITDTGYATACWIWKLARNQKGYARCRNAAGGLSLAHRAFYEEHVGPIPADRQLDHLCRRPACVNPAHLEPVSSAENVRRGLRTKLNAEAVQAIRTSDENQTVLARRYGIGQSQVSRIKSGVSWKSS